VALIRPPRPAVILGDCWTWGPNQCHQVHGFPQHALRLHSGNVLLTYGVRKPPCGVRGKLLDAECSDIDRAAETIIRDDSATGGCGYPASVQLADGTVFIVYYLTARPDGPARIAASVLREV